MSFQKYASVILDLSVGKTLDYGIKNEDIPKVQRGIRVEVPLRGHMKKGYIFAVKDKPDFPKVKAINRLLSENELITKDLFELALWMSRYYCTPLNQVLKSMIPRSIRCDVQHKEQLFVMRKKTRNELKEYCSQIRKKFPSQAQVLDIMLKITEGILLSELLEKAAVSRSPVNSLTKAGFLKLNTVRINRSPLINEEYIPSKAKILSSEQQDALNKIIQTLESEKFETHLLYGITGSGKTEVYLQAINHALKFKKGTVMLVPEISLTAQTVDRFKARFEEKVAILHHRLSPGEHYDEWHRIRRGETLIVIGARSAIFSPIHNLSLIIVDEEHESSYKQCDRPPCYHARDVAVMRAHLSKSCAILGSATPCLESFHNVEKGKFTLSILSKRPSSANLPDVRIVDMTHEDAKKKCFTTFSDPLLKAIEDRMSKGEQSLLFLNRRGYHAMQLCQSCNETVKCQHCDAGMTFHYKDQALICHLCGFTYSPPPHLCPSCKSPDSMKFRGVGTEQVERCLHGIFPHIRTLRLDADTTRHKGSHDRLLRNFRTGKADLMIGTQMIAKGLHFPQVTLVGVLNSDASLNIPDFRSSEKVFQLLTQVAGRSGRGQLSGEVIIQTRHSNNRTIELASKQDYDSFYKEEKSIREAFVYPPFSHMIKINFTGKHANRTEYLANQFHRDLALILPSDYDLSPVLPAAYAKVKDRFRFQFLLRGENVYAMNARLSYVKENIHLPSHVRLFIDVDPLSTFF